MTYDMFLDSVIPEIKKYSNYRLSNPNIAKDYYDHLLKMGFDVLWVSGVGEDGVTDILFLRSYAPKLYKELKRVYDRHSLIVGNNEKAMNALERLK